MAEDEWPNNQFEMSKEAVTEQKKSGRSKMKSVTEKHDEKQSLFADAVSKNKSTTGEPVENKLMKAGKENSWYLDPSHFSSWLRLTRLVAWVCRFLDNCQTAKEERIHGELTHEEIKDAEIHIIRDVQQDAFATEYQQLLKGKQMKSDSKLIALQPRIDEDGLLRCNGRLRYADFLPYDARYPIILPRKN
eukprot:Seg4920.2 transcript_id=Seg4920.2/GoldUCD/mRNA.D3Y31 product="hypothetical protein" protein_id=Seg4920.2/GoldUCD/D3Y31